MKEVEEGENKGMYLTMVPTWDFKIFLRVKLRMKNLKCHMRLRSMQYLMLIKEYVIFKVDLISV